MAAWTWADIVSQAKETILVAIGEKALTAQEEDRIRKETESAIIRAGGGLSEIKQANAEITSVIQENQREQVRLVEVPGKITEQISSIAGKLIADPKILLLAIGAVVVGYFVIRKRP